jgi:formylglycine-generating enzyme
MKKLTVILLFTLGLLRIHGQTLPISVLPKPVQKMLVDFALVKGDTLITGIYFGWDSLQAHLPKTLTLPSFYINRYEVSVDAYHKYCRENAATADCPDFTVWLSEFPYSFNKLIADKYFKDPAFHQHPVICVTWDQAVRYCVWQSKQINTLLDNSDYSVEIRLPSEAEWELAALGSKLYATDDQQGSTRRRMFPWDLGYFKIDENGLSFQCNAGPTRTPQGDFSLLGYGEDGYTYTAPVQSYEHNGAGLYQMAGNAAEWTSDRFSIDSIAIEKIIEKKPELLRNPKWLSQHRPPFPTHQYDDYMIVKGGSWVDEPFYMQIGVRKIQHPNRASATIGFRPVCVVSRKQKD